MAASYSSLRDLSRDPDLAVAIGNMVVVWAYAETVMLSALARVSSMRLNMAMVGYYRIPTFEARTKFILSLCTEWDTSEFDKAAIEQAIQKLAKLASTRNHWVHGDWCGSKDDKTVVIFDHRADPASLARRKVVKANDVRHHCDTVRSRADELNELIQIETLPI